ncbi:ABC transporter ATP-binding protein [Brevibacillus daliensis]|uniref:ABC transporter ATP-binding protein n=1 Tax=Brevibacillus daliensis TaxID=2892995 RepID=UPI001E4DB7B1|nr:ABC transporter ATP-binding protein [Brevibacillus daliensis]
MDNNRLIVKELSKKIKGQTLVEPVNIELPAGEIMALCGGNGAGKSTILRMIVGLMRPTTGEITVDGMSWQKNRTEYANLIGYMPDQFHFGTGLTADETLRFFASLRNLSSDRVDEVLELVGLTDVRKKRVNTFSKGMQQRLLFAQAIIASPRLVVLDEPTNGLDPYWMDEFVQLVKKIKQTGSSIIFSTHQLSVAELACDSAIFLQKGQVVQSGSIAHYREKYGAQGLQGAFDEWFLMNKQQERKAEIS